MASKFVFSITDDATADILRRYRVSEESINAIMARGLITSEDISELSKECNALNSEMECAAFLAERFGRYGIELAKVVDDWRIA